MSASYESRLGARLAAVGAELLETLARLLEEAQSAQRPRTPASVPEPPGLLSARAEPQRTQDAPTAPVRVAEERGAPGPAFSFGSPLRPPSPAPAGTETAGAEKGAQTEQTEVTEKAEKTETGAPGGFRVPGLAEQPGEAQAQPQTQPQMQGQAQMPTQT